ncbi:MAG: GNAT family N-acetyltransferase [Dehalococcoidales bacterium]|nr:GNAT family N-acetyltransferase [Dehalococcoidales bacterium]
MIEILKAEERHVPEIGDLWWEFMKYSREIDAIHEPEEDSKPIFEDNYLRPAMNDENSLVLAAIEDGIVRGYSYSLIVDKSELTTQDRFGCIHDMFITQNARNSGIGENMLKEIYTWFTANGIERIELDVLKNNRPAENFWRKQGFSEIRKTVYRMI